MPTFELLLLYALLGSFVGFMAGLLGVSGGGILVPLLAILFAYQGFSTDIVIHMSLGTALATMIITSCASVRAHASRGAVAWKIAAGMAPGIITGAFLTTRLAVHVDAVHIALFFAVFMALVSALMFFNWKPKPSDTGIHVIGLFLVGVGIGSVSALAAVGGGFLTVAYLSYKSIDMKKAIGTSAAIGLPIAIAGSAGYLVSGWSETLSESYTLGFIYMPAFLIIAATSIFAAPIGARLSHNLPEAQLKNLFALVSMALSIKMLVSVV